MVIKCQYKDGAWETYKFKRIELMNQSFRKDEERPVKIRTKDVLDTVELGYLNKYIDIRSGFKVIQE